MCSPLETYLAIARAQHRQTGVVDAVVLTGLAASGYELDRLEADLEHDPLG